MQKPASMRNRPRGSQPTSICMNTLVQSPGSLFRIAAKQRSYARATAITIRESMRFIALWRSIMAQPSFRPEFEHPRINQMPEAPLDMYPPGSLPRFVMNSSFRCPNWIRRSERNWMSSITNPFKRKRAADMNSSSTKNCHWWHPYLLPGMSRRNGPPQRFCSIITYPTTECYTLFLTNISSTKSMCG